MIAKKKIVVGLSGGVDSAVAALLLKNQGHDVLGLFMKNWEDEEDEFCPAKQDFLDVLAIAEILNIEVEAVNFAKEYKERVFNYFLAEYQAGRTPNPDVFCNSEIKFAAFLEHALTLGADYIATGHYAGITEAQGHFYLVKACDLNKDQSYFLYRLQQHQLARSLFPLAHLSKPEVRKMAREAKLPVHAKKDSTGICFIGERPFRDFLARYLPKDPGEIRTLEGKLIGHHQGLMYYTLGQRQGLGIGGAGLPWFVAAKDRAANVLTVVQGHDHPALFFDHLEATNLSWVNAPIDVGGAYQAKTRYTPQSAACQVSKLSPSEIQVSFTTPQWGVTPGQSVVLYEGDVCLGGGVIS